jgi:hypothetical protein
LKTNKSDLTNLTDNLISYKKFINSIKTMFISLCELNGIKIKTDKKDINSSILKNG